MRLTEPPKWTESPPEAGFTHYYPFQLVISNLGKGNAPGCSGTFTLKVPGNAKRSENSPENGGSVEEMPRGFQESPDTRSYSFEVTANVYPGAERILYIAKFAFMRNWLQSKMEGPFLTWELYTDGMEPDRKSVV